MVSKNLRISGFKATYQCYLKNNFGEYFSNNPLPLAAVLQMIVEKDTVMIKAAHVGQLLFHKKEKVWQRERIIVYHVYYCVIDRY